MFKPDLEKLIEFTKFLNEFHRVQRAVWATGENRMENDAEHSFQLAMTAWYLITLHKLEYDLYLVLQYALAHDLVEIYAGDTGLFSKDRAHKESKAQREHEAFLKIKQKFLEFPELTEIIQKYELKGDPESLFVYALDKILPPLNIHLDNGRAYQTQKVTLKMEIESKTDKVAVSPEIKEYYEEIKILWEKNSHYFAQKGE